MSENEPIVESETVSEQGSRPPILNPNDMEFLNDVKITLTIEVGRTQLKIRDLLSLTKDSIIDLDKSAGEPVDIYANGKLISRGNIITANGKYCVRLTSVTIPVGQKAKEET
jgi:flagellar motor switch protein FliN